MVYQYGLLNYFDLNRDFQFLAHFVFREQVPLLTHACPCNRSTMVAKESFSRGDQTGREAA
jgi:hypothetical protein